MTRYLLAAMIALATHPAVACPPQAASSCNVQHVQRVQKVVKQQVYAPAVQQHAYVQQQQQYYVAQDAYGNGYNNQIVLQRVYKPVAYSVGAHLQEEAIAERVARKALERLDQQLGAAAERHDRRGGTRFDEHPGLKVAQKECATCHAKGSAKVAEGNAPELFSGLGEWTGSPEQAVAAVDAARLGTMPKGKPELSDDDFFALKAYLTEATSPIGK